MPEMHLRQPGFNYSACIPFMKNKEFKNLKKEEIQNIFIKTNQIKLVFNLIWLMEILTTAEKVLGHKAFDIPKHPRCDGDQRGLASMV